MKISSVQNIQSTPVFFYGIKSTAITQTAPAMGDVFVKSATSEFEVLKNNLYEKTLSNIGVVSKENIKKTVENIVSKTGLDESSIYKTLAKITAYSSYKSLDKIQKGLKEIGNPIVSKVFIQNQTNTPNTHLISFSDALSYVLKRNYPLDYIKTKNSCIVLNSELLDYLEKASEEKRAHFISHDLEQTKLVHFEDFEEGYNFLNRGESLEDFAVNYITSNKDTLANRANALGLDFITVKNKIPENITPETIARNLNPIYPTKEKFSKIIDSMIKKDLPEAEIEENKKYVLKFLDKMLFPISPEKYSQYMKAIKANIDSFLEHNKKNPKNVYYIIPDNRKSFITTNYYYKKANNLEKPNYVFPDFSNWFEKEYNIKDLPDNSTIVVLDDCVMTGLTLAKEEFNYRSVIEKIKSAKKNISIVLASAVGTKSGIFNLNNMIKQHGRENKDIVLSGAILPQWKLTSSTADEKYLNIEDMPNRYLTALILPYMAPDTNLGIVRPLIQNFLYSKNAQKSNYPHFNSIFFA